MSNRQITYRVRTGLGSEDASNALGQALNQWLQNYGPSEIYKTCENCRHMTEQGPAFCALYQVTPPVAVIIAGCPSHDDKEDVPF